MRHFELHLVLVSKLAPYIKKQNTEMAGKKAIQFSDATRIDKVPDAFSVMAKPIGPKCNLNCSYCYYLEK
nr:hypothetical protein [Bacteroidales bacterium]